MWSCPSRTRWAKHYPHPRNFPQRPYGIRKRLTTILETFEWTSLVSWLVLSKPPVPCFLKDSVKASQSTDCRPSLAAPQILSFSLRCLRSTQIECFTQVSYWSLPRPASSLSCPLLPSDVILHIKMLNLSMSSFCMAHNTEVVSSDTKTAKSSLEIGEVAEMIAWGEVKGEGEFQL